MRARATWRSSRAPCTTTRRRWLRPYRKLMNVGRTVIDARPDLDWNDLCALLARVGGVLALLLWLAVPASAAPITPAMVPCGCSLVEVLQVEPAHIDTTGGWDLFVGSADEKAAAQLADLLWEPAAAPPVLALVCLPRVPWARAAGQPGGELGVLLYDGGELGRPDAFTVGDDAPGTVPEPSAWALLVLGGVVRRRHAR